MKYLLLTACFASCLLLGSCKKDKVANAGELIGTWELHRTSAALVAGDTALPFGNGHLLKFSRNAYEVYQHQQLVEKGSYKLVIDNTVQANVCLVFPAGQFETRIIYNGDRRSAKSFIQITGNQLTMISGCYAIDAGHSEEYKRVLQ